MDKKALIYWGGYFNSWALELTDLEECKLLLYFYKLNWAQDRLLQNYMSLVLLPMCPNNFPFHNGSKPQFEETI